VIVGAAQALMTGIKDQDRLQKEIEAMPTVGLTPDQVKSHVKSEWMRLVSLRTQDALNLLRVHLGVNDPLCEAYAVAATRRVELITKLDIPVPIGGDPSVPLHARSIEAVMSMEPERIRAVADFAEIRETWTSQARAAIDKL
jgi:hypothetical protein